MCVVPDKTNSLSIVIFKSQNLTNDTYILLYIFFQTHWELFIIVSCVPVLCLFLKKDQLSKSVVIEMPQKLEGMHLDAFEFDCDLVPYCFSYAFFVFLYPSVPNPPGPIEVLLVTTSSIEIKWTAPHLMIGASFQYRVIISSPHADEPNVTNIMVESHTFNSLPSGTPFNVSVQTFGIMMFVSEKAQTQMVTTSKELKLKTG